ncbi:MAG: outer membrane protein assembly factor BamE [Rhodocyclaceae bacterium]|nr:outer membrane protein assembly factor BamE [Rhodocyclaceae bacterium]
MRWRNGPSPVPAAWGGAGEAFCQAPGEPGLCYIFYPFLRTATPSRQVPSPFMRSYLAAALVASGLVAGCSFDSVVGVVDPYRIDIRQGNYVDQEMLSQLRRGMTRDQVRYVLGSPLVVGMFRKDRWDYVYRFRPGSGEAQQRVISLYFAGDALDRVEGDVAVAQGGETGAEAAAAESRSRVVEIPPLEED